MWTTIKWTLTTVIVVLLIALSGLIGFTIADDDDDGGTSVSNGDTSDATNADFGILTEIEDVLENDFVNPDAVSEDLLEQGAIEGMISSLGDPHTVYFSPEDAAQAYQAISGSFEGIGATVDQDPTTGEITIVAPFRDSPAEKAGVLPGDVILAVDDEPADGWSVRDAVDRIRGPEGTDVKITVRHSNRETEDIIITRNNIVLPSVFAHPVTDEDGNEIDGYAYIELQQFTSDAVDEMRAELNAIKDSGATGLILDLRRNPGGALDATVEIADMFLDGGTVLTQVDRDGNETVFSAESGGEAIDIPVVILVGNGSASGSEVLAGALRDHGRAKLVGTQTFGKGSVNIIRDLSNGGVLYVSIARWLTPNDTLIEGVGLTPDVPVELDPEALSEELQTGYGPQIAAAIDLLNEDLAAAAQ